MAIVRSILEVGAKLTPEQIEEIREAVKHPYIYDPDCPLLTEEQLAQFRPVSGTWEERAIRMEEAYQNGTLERPRPEVFQKKPAEEIVSSYIE